MIPAYWLNYHAPEVRSPGMWDQTIISWLLTGRSRMVADLKEVREAIVVIPGRFHEYDLDQINEECQHLEKVTYVISSDEENLFPVYELHHPNRTEWVQTPDPLVHARLFPRWLPVGWSPHSYLAPAERRYYDWAFLGQVTHPRREELMHVLADMQVTRSYLMPTQGFTQGLPPEQYMAILRKSKVVFCPSGPESVDTFRLWETLDAGAIPIIERRTPFKDMSGYWKMLGDHPIPVVDSWHDVMPVLDYALNEWGNVANTIREWYLDWRTNLRMEFWK